MKKLFTLCLLAVCLSAMSQSQSRILCGNEILPNVMEQRIPGYKAAVNAAFNQAKTHHASRASAVDSNYTIPVVFHVVYGAAIENLDDSIILSELQVLNEDYSRLNADTGNTVSYFDSVAADTHIRFSLQGIQRVQTTNSFTFSFFGLPDSLIKTTLAGGDDAIDPDHTLNIWIVNMRASLFGQLLGYSYPPDSLSNWPVGQSAPSKAWDGVVLDYRTIGTNNPNPLNFSGQNLIVRGRTATHEVGHYLGLRHIWGDGATFGTNDCQQSDGIDDTPFANAQSNFDCDTTRNSCMQTETYYGADAPDMVQNYMDYSSEACMNLFTKGQAELMRGTLDHNRPGLATRTARDTSATNPATGLAKINAAAALALYPNPTTGIVHITYSEVSNPYTSIQVYDMIGSALSVSQVPHAGSVQLDMSGLPGGIYTLDAVKAGAHITRKVVLSK